MYDLTKCAVCLAAKTKVLVSRFAEKQIQKLPAYLREVLYFWVFTVETIAYRAVYIETQKEVEVQVIEVHKHGY